MGHAVPRDAVAAIADRRTPSAREAPTDARVRQRELANIAAAAATERRRERELQQVLQDVQVVKGPLCACGVLWGVVLWCGGLVVW